MNRMMSGKFPVLIALAIMVAGLGSLAWAQTVMHVVLQKLPTQLQKPLPDLPRALGQYKVPPGSADQRLPEDQVQTLGTNIYLLRDYWNTKLPMDSPGAVIQVNINFYPTDFATPHVPDVCWTANGMQRLSDDLITIHNVPHADGSVSDLQMRLESFAASDSDDSETDDQVASAGGVYFVAYVFQVDGAYVPNPEQVSEMFWNQTARFGYDAKIEVRVVLPSTPQQAQAAITEFIRAALPSIEKCLPDWKKLTTEGK
ncbi:MAG TPA: exosortase-associated EpsI family protein [Phycisphaerae bacterium]|nr:exosortase-associated EpsI family protein [Phycisphaerae bacterium]